MARFAGLLGAKRRSSLSSSVAEPTAARNADRERRGARLNPAARLTFRRYFKSSHACFRPTLTAGEPRAVAGRDRALIEQLARAPFFVLNPEALIDVRDERRRMREGRGADLELEEGNHVYAAVDNAQRIETNLSESRGRLDERERTDSTCSRPNGSQGPHSAAGNRVRLRTAGRSPAGLARLFPWRKAVSTLSTGLQSAAEGCFLGGRDERG
jgi:hypothetical protein